MNSAIEIDSAIAFEAISRWASEFSHFAFYINSDSDFKASIGAHRFIQLEESQGAFDKLQKFQQESSWRIAGFLGYDLKNDLEDLRSENPNFIEAPVTAFFEPLLWVSVFDGKMEIQSQADLYSLELIRWVKNYESQPPQNAEGHLSSDTDREAYLKHAHAIKNHLQRGDIYEANYCIQFSGEVSSFDPVSYFIKLQQKTHAPFSIFAKFQDFHIMSASPERFMRNEGGRLISQPIKGTRKRGMTESEDREQIEILQNDQKELSENVMIVDLVRNDLSRVAARGSVKVDELFGVQSFQTVHHLVSTVSAQLNKAKYAHWDAIKACFPMGSMTGAPKIRAMQIIEDCETFKRGAYSGAFGWMDPDGDFDFNVLIRTLFFNQSNNRISMGVGSAMTIGADPEKEYEECLLKAQALVDTLKVKSESHEAN